MLQKIGFQPGINKRNTHRSRGQWIDCDNVRFRYGTRKIGGWKQLGENKLTGAGRVFIIL